MEPDQPNSFSSSRWTIQGAPIDSRIAYPCYKSFDEFVDIDRLKSLDTYVSERIKRHIASRRDIEFYTGPYRLDPSAPARPGVRMIYLAQSRMPDNYFDLDRPELWEHTEEAEEFAVLMDFIKGLPFSATGRILIMYDDAPRASPAHRDHVEVEVCHEFIWFRTNLSKPFYLLDPQTNEKRYVLSHSAWFDTVNQFHGTDPADGLTFSIRVDGTFTEAFKRQIPVPENNPASTPALWACL